jgi:hypothetical protein
MIASPSSARLSIIASCTATGRTKRSWVVVADRPAHYIH